MANTGSELKKGIALMLCSSICVCIGQLLWKLYALNGNIMLMLAGFMLYGMGALIMVVAYRYGSLSVLQPVLSMNYVITIVLSVLVLHESISILKLVGIVCVSAGVVVIGGSKE